MVLQDDIFTFVSIKIITIIIFFPSMKLHFIFKPADIARRLTAIKLQKQSKTGFVPTVIHLSTELSTMSYFTRKKGRLKKRPFIGMYAYVRFFVTSTAAAIAATAMTIRAVSPLSPVAGTEEAGEELRRALRKTFGQLSRRRYQPAFRRILPQALPSALRFR